MSNKNPKIFGDIKLKSEDKLYSSYQAAPEKLVRRDEHKEKKEKRKSLVSAKDEAEEDMKLDLDDILASEVASLKEEEIDDEEIYRRMTTVESTEAERGAGAPMVEDKELEEGEMMKDDISILKKSEVEFEVAPPPPPTSGAPSQPSDGMGGAPEPATAATPKAPEPASAPRERASEVLDMAPKAPEPTLAKPAIEPEEPKPTTYNINMGFQYYSVMMEQKSYLFYVYLSHEELKILDEEGKPCIKLPLQ
ncbi:unnamed protein product [marine sediment metagenome]|uniref:Uncharacterized protein n=1 Tax=marine sediment metagenome TaxID=412755 RepID=X1HFQ2_9ZZZZ